MLAPIPSSVARLRCAVFRCLSHCLLLSLGGCISSACESQKNTADCDRGAEQCACFGNGTCNDGLVCLSQHCVSWGDDGGGDASGGQLTDAAMADDDAALSPASIPDGAGGRPTESSRPHDPEDAGAVCADNQPDASCSGVAATSSSAVEAPASITPSTGPSSALSTAGPGDSGTPVAPSAATASASSAPPTPPLRHPEALDAESPTTAGSASCSVEIRPDALCRVVAACGTAPCRATFEWIWAEVSDGGATEALTFKDLSGDGSVVLGVHTFTTGADDEREGYVWRWGTEAVTYLPDSAGSYPLGINSDATIAAGAALACEGEDCSYPAARWSSAGVSLVPGNPGALYGISDDGSVVGFERNSQQILQSYVSDGTNTTFIATLALSNLSGDATRAGGTVDGGGVVLWSNTGAQEAIPSTSPLRADAVNAINGDGSVVVGYGWDMNALNSPMFRWRVGAGVDVVQPLAGFPEISPWDVTADGEVIVGMNRQYAVQPPTPVTDLEAFLWDPTGGVRSVTDELIARGITLPTNLHLHNVKISSDGSVLAGNGFQAGTPILWRVELLP